MVKIATNNLGMIITEKCNLNCHHCLQGQCSNKMISDDVINATLQQFCYIANLSVCGGEPTLALDRIEKIFSYIVENNIHVESISTTINGTIYSAEFLRLLKYIDEYMQNSDKIIFQPETTFTISRDQFHAYELERLQLIERYNENVRKYAQSPFYAGQVSLGKIIREGNAETLPCWYTYKFKPSKPIINYPNGNTSQAKNTFIWLGPYIAINPDGVVTEIDASIEHQQSLYNYGNVLNEPISDMFEKRPKRKVLVKASANKFFKECDKELIK